MEQSLSTLSLDKNKLKELKLIGFEYFNRNDENEDLKNLFNDDEFCKLTKAPITQNALEMYHTSIISGSIFTYIRSLDSLLQDEIAPGSIVELCGEAGSGKTQICFQLCVNVQLPTVLGGREGKALYLCSNYNFSIRRIREIATNTVNKLSKIETTADIFKLSTNDILSNIHHVPVTKYQELIATVAYLKKFLRNNTVRLLIIDSITMLAQQIATKDRKYVLYTCFSDLQALASEHNFVIIITNNVTLRNKSTTEIEATPALGENFFHRVNSRILFQRISRNNYEATVIKSLCNPTKSVYFNL